MCVRIYIYTHTHTIYAQSLSFIYKKVYVRLSLSLSLSLYVYIYIYIYIYTHTHRVWECMNWKPWFNVDMFNTFIQIHQYLTKFCFSNQNSPILSNILPNILILVWSCVCVNFCLSMLLYPHSLILCIHTYLSPVYKSLVFTSRPLWPLNFGLLNPSLNRAQRNSIHLFQNYFIRPSRWIFFLVLLQVNKKNYF